MSSIRDLRAALTAIPEAAITRTPAILEGIEQAIAYLESDAAIASIEADAYWPKWHSPWWHMTLLWELGMHRQHPGPRRAGDGEGLERAATPHVPDPRGRVAGRRESAARHPVPLRARHDGSGADRVRRRRRSRAAVDPAVVLALPDGRRRAQLRRDRVPRRGRVPELDGWHGPTVRGDAAPRPGARSPIAPRRS